MKRILMMAALGLIAVLGVMTATQTWAATEAAATLKSVRGRAVIERAGKALPAKAGDALYEQDRLKTGPESYLGLGFTDQSLLSVGPNSEVNLAKYRFDRTTHQGEQNVGIKSGSLSAISGKIAKASPEQVRFNTGSVTLGVRGTEFLIDVGYIAPCSESQYWKDAQGVPVRTVDGGCVAMAWVDERSPSPALDRFYLLPDRDGRDGRDGRVGAISLRSDGVTLEIDKAYAGGEIGRLQPLRKEQSTKAAVMSQYGTLLSALPSAAQTFVLQFMPGSATSLTPASEEVLQSMLVALRAWPDVPDVLVVGHTDTVGSLRANDALSLKRAQTVRAILLQQGVASARVVAAGRGERELRVATPNEVAEAENRRVAVTVY